MAELLKEHYKLGRISQARDGWSYDVTNEKPWENEEDNIWVAYWPEGGEFKIRMAKNFGERIKELLAMDRRNKDAEKNKVEFGDKSGADSL